jgi:hypothetical protein
MSALTTPPAHAWLEVRTINGRPYTYWRWREGKRKRSQYVGAGDLRPAKTKGANDGK